MEHMATRIQDENMIKHGFTCNTAQELALSLSLVRFLIFLWSYICPLEPSVLILIDPAVSWKCLPSRCGEKLTVMQLKFNNTCVFDYDDTNFWGNQDCWSQFRFPGSKNGHFRSFQFVWMVNDGDESLDAFEMLDCSYQFFKEFRFYRSQWSRSCVMANALAAPGDRRAVWEALAMGEELLVRASNAANFNWQARMGWMMDWYGLVRLVLIGQVAATLAGYPRCFFLPLKM